MKTSFDQFTAAQRSLRSDYAIDQVDQDKTRVYEKTVDFYLNKAKEGEAIKDEKKKKKYVGDNTKKAESVLIMSERFQQYSNMRLKNCEQTKLEKLEAGKRIERFGKLVPKNYVPRRMVVDEDFEQLAGVLQGLEGRLTDLEAANPQSSEAVRAVKDTLLKLGENFLKAVNTRKENRGISKKGTAAELEKMYDAAMSSIDNLAGIQNLPKELGSQLKSIKKELSKGESIGVISHTIVGMQHSENLIYVSGADLNAGFKEKEIDELLTLPTDKEMSRDLSKYSFDELMRLAVRSKEGIRRFNLLMNHYGFNKTMDDEEDEEPMTQGQKNVKAAIIKKLTKFMDFNDEVVEKLVSLSGYDKGNQLAEYMYGMTDRLRASMISDIQRQIEDNKKLPENERKSEDFIKYQAMSAKKGRLIQNFSDCFVGFAMSINSYEEASRYVGVDRLVGYKFAKDGIGINPSVNNLRELTKQVLDKSPVNPIDYINKNSEADKAAYNEDMEKLLDETLAGEKLYANNIRDFKLRGRGEVPKDAFDVSENGNVELWDSISINDYQDQISEMLDRVLAQGENDSSFKGMRESLKKLKSSIEKSLVIEQKEKEGEILTKEELSAREYLKGNQLTSLMNLRSAALKYSESHTRTRLTISGSKRKTLANDLLNSVENMISTLPAEYKSAAYERIIRQDVNVEKPIKRSVDFLTKEAKNFYGRQHSEDKNYKDYVEKYVDYRSLIIRNAEERTGSADSKLNIKNRLEKLVPGYGELLKEAKDATEFDLETYIPALLNDYSVDEEGNPLQKTDEELAKKNKGLILAMLHAKETENKEIEIGLVTTAKKEEDAKTVVNHIVDSILNLKISDKWAEPEYIVLNYGSIRKAGAYVSVMDELLEKSEEVKNYFDSLSAEVKEQFALKANLASMSAKAAEHMRPLAMKDNKAVLDGSENRLAIAGDIFSKDRSAVLKEFRKKGRVKIDPMGRSADCGHTNEDLVRYRVSKEKKGYVKSWSDGYENEILGFINVYQDMKDELKDNLSHEGLKNREKREDKESRIREWRRLSPEEKLAAYNEKNKGRNSAMKLREATFRRYFKIKPAELNKYFSYIKPLLKPVRIGEDGLPLTKQDEANDSWNLDLYESTAAPLNAENKTYSIFVLPIERQLIDELADYLQGVDDAEYVNAYNENPEKFIRACEICENIDKLSEMERLTPDEKLFLKNAKECMAIIREHVREKCAGNAKVDILKGTYLEEGAKKMGSGRSYDKKVARVVMKLAGADMTKLMKRIRESYQEKNI